MNKRIKKKKQTAINKRIKQFDEYLEDEVEDAVIISESFANKLLDGTFDGLINYHEAVAGCGGKRSMIRDERSNNPCER